MHRTNICSSCRSSSVPEPGARVRASAAGRTSASREQLGVSAGEHVYSWTSDIELSAEQRRTQSQRADRSPEPRGRRPTRARDVVRDVPGQSASPTSKKDASARERRMTRYTCSGCMLYWAEGNEGTQRPRLRELRASPMVVAFCRFLRESLGVERDAPPARRSTHTRTTASRSTSIEAHWFDGARDYRASCVRKHIVDHMPTSSSGRAAQSARLRRVLAEGRQHARAPAHLRRDPGVRRFR